MRSRDRARRLVLTLAATFTLATGPAFAQSPPSPPPPPAPSKLSGDGPQPTDLIAKGQAQFEDQRYEESIQTLSAALLRPSNSHAQKVEIHRLLALDYITLGRMEEAESAVRGLLVLSPDYALPESESPRFRDFFAEVRGKWEAEGRPGSSAPAASGASLSHTPPATAAPGKALTLRGRVADPAHRIVGVDLHVRPGGRGDFSSVPTTLAEGAFRADVPAAQVKPPILEYFFDARDAAGEVVTSRGDATTPLRIAVPDAAGGGGGWVLPVAIGGGILGAAAIVGGLALAGVFGGGSADSNNSTVSISVRELGR